MIIKSRAQFQKTSGLSGVYQWLIKNAPELLDVLLPPTRKKWDAQMIIEDAKKYKTKIEWMNKSRYAYTLSKVLNIHSQCAGHFQSNIAQHFNRRVINKSTGEVYPSIKKAATALGIGYTSISHAIGNRQPLAGGYRWAYCDEYGNVLKSPTSRRQNADYLTVKKPKP